MWNKQIMWKTGTCQSYEGEPHKMGERPCQISTDDCSERHEDDMVEVEGVYQHKNNIPPYG